MKKKLFIIVCVVAVMIGTSILFSIDIYQSTFPNEPAKKTMHKLPWYNHNYIAQDKVFFEDEGVNVELVLVDNVDDNLQYCK